LHVLNHQNSREIGNVLLNKNLTHVRILVNNDTQKSCSTLHDFHGQIVFVNNSNTLCSVSFEDLFTQIKTYEYNIEDVVILSSKKALVCFKTLFQLVTIDHESEIDRENPYKPERRDTIVDEHESIVFVQATVPNHLVYTSSFDKMARIVILVALANNKVKVYDFNKKSEKLNLLASVDLVDINQVSNHANMFCIDENYTIEYIMCKKLYELESNLALAVRFAVSDTAGPNVSCVSVMKNGEYTTEKINESTIKLANYADTLTKFEILGFFQNKIILKTFVGRHSVDLYVYDLGNFSY
jgi:hypothetical protein